MKILYFGCDSFGIPSLGKLSASHEITAVVTSPDKPAGRGMKVCSGIVKKWARSAGVKVLQPEKLDGKFAEVLKPMEIDLILLVSYGKKLPASILGIPSFAPINVHPSLLPAYRGAAPMEWALINGEKETGITVITMSREIDKGCILASERTPIGENDDIFELKERLAAISARLLPRVIREIGEGRAKAVPQEGRPSYTRKLTRKDGLIDWQKSCEGIHNLIRGVKEWPGAYTFLPDHAGSRCLKIFSSEKNRLDGRCGNPGEIISVSDRTLEVSCGHGSIFIKEVQVEGKKKIMAGDFARGYRIKAGMVFSKGRNCPDGQN